MVLRVEASLNSQSLCWSTPCHGNTPHTGQGVKVFDEGPPVDVDRRARGLEVEGQPPIRWATNASAPPVPCATSKRMTALSLNATSSSPPVTATSGRPPNGSFVRKVDRPCTWRASRRRPALPDTFPWHGDNNVDILVNYDPSYALNARTFTEEGARGVLPG